MGDIGVHGLTPATKTHTHIHLLKDIVAGRLDHCHVSPKLQRGLGLGVFYYRNIKEGNDPLALLQLHVSTCYFDHEGDTTL